MAWELDEAIWERSDGANGWTTDPLTVDNNSFWTFRAAFKIRDVPVENDPINLGNIQPQRNIDGAGWTDYFTPGKNVTPGFTKEFIESFPEYVYWDCGFNTPGVDVDTRMELDWDGGPYYSDAILVTVNEAAATTEVQAPSTVVTEQTAGAIAGTEQEAGAIAASEVTFTPGSISEVLAGAIAASEVTFTPGSISEVSGGAIAATETSAGAIAASEVSGGAIAASEVAAGSPDATEQTASPDTIGEL
jgi:hypothetical protein